MIYYGDTIPPRIACSNFATGVRELPGAWCVEVPAENRVTLYVYPESYHYARALCYWTLPAFVYVDIIPLEFTS
jgi:hypothetical protein